MGLQANRSRARGRAAGGGHLPDPAEHEHGGADVVLRALGNRVGDKPARDEVGRADGGARGPRDVRFVHLLEQPVRADHQEQVPPRLQLHAQQLGFCRQPECLQRAVAQRARELDAPRHAHLAVFAARHTPAARLDRRPLRPLLRHVRRGDAHRLPVAHEHGEAVARARHVQLRPPCAAPVGEEAGDGGTTRVVAARTRKPAMGEESVLPLALLACSRLTTAVGMASAQCSAQASPPCPSRSSTRLGRSEASRWQRRTVLSSMRSAPLRPGDASEAPSTRRERARTCCPDSAAERGREAEAAGGCARTEPACSAGSGGGGGARWTICKASVLPLTADTPICVRTASRCAKALTTAERPAEVPAGRPASAAAASSEAEAADMLGLSRGEGLHSRMLSIVRLGGARDSSAMSGRSESATTARASESHPIRISITVCICSAEVLVPA
mmetsp:Transcript_37999/g.89303  ORF Transcript_37999/g.89303 Transcript_37999/m.89303 type:complete len:444 (-) Transcript_37999:723-2054(-)